MLMQILFQILQRTPAWVYGLFFGLLALGYVQSKSRELSPLRLAVLPLALGTFSLTQIWASFSAQPVVFAAWGAGIGAALLAHRAFGQPNGARWSAASGTFHVPGSWVPLALMMAMFFSRYALAVSLALRPGMAHSAAFASAAGFGLGLLSGTFFARALWVWSQRKARAVAGV